MRIYLPALLLLLAAQAGAQSFISMGRLFTTPSERAQLDAQRSQAPAATAAASGSLGGVGGPAGMAGAGGHGAGAAGVADGAPGHAADAGAGAAGSTGDARQDVQLGGIVRSSNGHAMMIVNGEVKPAPAGGVLRGGVRVEADGRSIILKPGQRYDPATGEIHEAAR